MEFPNLGEHCFEKTCNRLDFLPMKCDACANIFCQDHFRYDHHNCNNSFQKDVYVPVCPLCSKPVPSKRGEQPDIAVGEHIDKDCQSDAAVTKRTKIYTNQCNVKGCKQKEVIPITCNVCLKNYCLRHRHPADHKCQEQKPPVPNQAAGAAAMARVKKIRLPWQSNQSGASNVAERRQSNQSCASNVGERRLSSQSCASSAAERRRAPNPPPPLSMASMQGRLTEDEALALALQNSMKETRPMSLQEEEDRLLAQALANSEIQRVGTPQRLSEKNDNLKGKAPIKTISGRLAMPKRIAPATPVCVRHAMPKGKAPAKPVTVTQGPPKGKAKTKPVTVTPGTPKGKTKTKVYAPTSATPKISPFLLTPNTSDIFIVLH